MSMIKTVRITSENGISIVDLPGWSLEDQEKVIGADCTEIVRTQRMYDLFKDSVVMIVDESGKVKERPDNLVASLLYGADQHGCTIAGDIIFGVLRDANVLPPENPELLKFFLKDHFPMLREVRGGETL